MRVAFVVGILALAHPRALLASAQPLGTPPSPAAPAPPAVPKDKPKENDDKSGRCCAALKSLGFSSNLPVFIIDTAGQIIPGGPPPGGGEPDFEAKKIEVTLCTCTPPGAPGAAAESLDYLGNAGASIRGSTTRKQYVKKSYAIELRDGLYPNRTAGGASRPQAFPLLGLPKESDWALYGPEEDAEMGLRNWQAYEGYRTQGGHWSPRTRFCEAFVKQDSGPLTLAHYNGIYLLVEKIKINKNRVNIKKLNVTKDLTGGWIWKYDNDNTLQHALAGRWTSSVSGLLYGFEQPLNPPKAAADWLIKYWGDFETAAAGPDFMDPQKGYSAFLDVPNTVDYFLNTELTKNPDGYRGSIYMYKDAGAKSRTRWIPWDYNEAFGMCCGYPLEGYKSNGQSGPGVSGGSAISANGWRFNICENPERCVVEPADGISRYFQHMWRDPAFRNLAATRYLSLRQGNWSDAYLLGNLNAKLALIRPAAYRNYDRWRAVLYTPYAQYFASPQAKFEYEAKTMIDWVAARLKWMDQAMTLVSQGSETGVAGSPKLPPWPPVRPPTWGGAVGNAGVVDTPVQAQSGP